MWLTSKSKMSSYAWGALTENSVKFVLTPAYPLLAVSTFLEKLSP